VGVRSQTGVWEREQRGVWERELRGVWERELKNLPGLLDLAGFGASQVLGHRKFL